MTTTQILELARKKALEETSELLSDSTLLIYANFANQDVTRRAFPNNSVLTTAVSFTSGVGTLPTDFGTMYGDAYTNSDSIFPEISMNEFVREPLEQCVTIDAGVMKVLPTTTSTINIKYYPSYPDLTASVNPTIDSYFHEVIVYGILFRAYEDLQDEALSKYYRDKYEAELTQKINVQSNYEESNQRGGTMFNGINII